MAKRSNRTLANVTLAPIVRTIRPESLADRCQSAIDTLRYAMADANTNNRRASLAKRINRLADYAEKTGIAPKCRDTVSSPHIETDSVTIDPNDTTVHRQAADGSGDSLADRYRKLYPIGQVTTMRDGRSVIINPSVVIPSDTDDGKDIQTDVVGYICKVVARGWFAFTAKKTNKRTIFYCQYSGNNQGSKPTHGSVAYRVNKLDDIIQSYAMAMIESVIAMANGPIQTASSFAMAKGIIRRAFYIPKHESMVDVCPITERMPCNSGPDSNRFDPMADSIKRTVYGILWANQTADNAVKNPKLALQYAILAYLAMGFNARQVSAKLAALPKPIKCPVIQVYKLMAEYNRDYVMPNRPKNVFHVGPMADTYMAADTIGHTVTRKTIVGQVSKQIRKYRASAFTNELFRKPTSPARYARSVASVGK